MLVLLNNFWARLLGPDNIVRGKIHLVQQKTGKELTLPIHPRLAASLKGIPDDQEAFILNSKGTPFTIDSFGIWFKRRCIEAGVEGKSMHGLRKAAACRMALAGLSNQVIKSVTGHTSDAEVSRYTAKANQERMAEIGVGALI